MSDKERALEMEIEALRKQVVGLGGTPVGRRTVGGGGAQRKKGVAICSEQIIEEDYSPPIFPKGEAARHLIETAMSGSSIFGNLSPEQWEAIIGAMYPAQRKAGEPVIVQEEPAQNYFVIDSGKCDVFMRRDLTGSDELVLTIGTGACFGEIALMYECHNNITIKAHQDVTVWTIDRKTFRSIVVHSTSRKRRQYELFLSKVDLFNTLTGTEKALLADALEDITYNDGDVLMQYGEEGDYFYICTKGTATVMSNQGDILAVRGVGEYFGEAALKDNKPRMATIVATGEVECARMDRQTFTRILGPLTDILSFREYDPETGIEIKGQEPEAAAVAATAAANGARANEFSEEPGGPNPVLNRTDFDSGPVLGIGAFGYVQLVHHKKTGKTYALKTLTKRSIIKTDQFIHCADEIANLRAASNPFIVNLYSCFQDAMCIYMVMEFAPGGELYSIIQRGKLKNPDAMLLCAETMLALEYTHAQQIVYRDLKPENVLLDDDGHVKLTDFGLSKMVVDRTFTLCGTPDYIAPEIIQNRGHNKAADFWALGVVLYEMLSSLPPFWKENEEHTTFDRICQYSAKIRKLQLVWPAEISADARSLIEGLLEPDVTRRLGCMSNGTKDIRDHAWFAGFDWPACKAKTEKGFYALQMQNNDDVSAFDDYSSESLPKPRPLKKGDQQKYDAKYVFF